MSLSAAPLRGEVWLVDFDPVRGHEQGGLRPALVISSDRFNAGRGQLAVVLPMTTRDRQVPTHVRLVPPEGGLLRPSLILCDQIRTVMHHRLNHRLGQATGATLGQVEVILMKILGLGQRKMGSSAIRSR